MLHEKIRNDDSLFAQQSMTVGVSQGPILGPLLFLCTSMKSTCPYGMHLLPYLLMTQRCPIEVLQTWRILLAGWKKTNLLLTRPSLSLCLLRILRSWKMYLILKLTINNCTLEREQLEVRDFTMVFKCLNGLAPPYLCQKFKTRSEVHNCNTRNRDRLHIPLCRTAAGQRAFTFRGQKLWNSLPDEFQSITNLDVFKVKIEQHFLRVFLEN